MVIRENGILLALNTGNVRCTNFAKPLAIFLDILRPVHLLSIIVNFGMIGRLSKAKICNSSVALKRVMLYTAKANKERLKTLIIVTKSTWVAEPSPQRNGVFKGNPCWGIA